MRARLAIGRPESNAHRELIGQNGFRRRLSRKGCGWGQQLFDEYMIEPNSVDIGVAFTYLLNRQRQLMDFTCYSRLQLRYKRFLAWWCHRRGILAQADAAHIGPASIFACFTHVCSAVSVRSRFLATLPIDWPGSKQSLMVSALNSGVNLRRALRDLAELAEFIAFLLVS